MDLHLPDAAHVLGVLPWRAEQILGPGPHTIDDAEQAALEHYRPSDHTHDPYSYWVTVGQAAGILRVSSARVGQLCVAGKIPFLVHRGGKRLMRRAQVEVIANARESRKLGHHHGG